MHTRLLRKRLGQIGAATGAATLALMAVATPAFADTSTASANALTATLAGQSIANTGLSTASNDGTQPTQTASVTGIHVLDSQNGLDVSGLSQEAVARNDGSSSACAGAVGPGGILQIGQSGACTGSANSTHGIDIGNGQIVADVVYASCSATSSGKPTGSATIVNLNLGGSGQPGTIAAPPNTEIPPAPPNQLFNIILNKQTTNPDGSLTVTALDATALTPAQGGLHVAIGTVTCGPNAAAAPTPAIPVKGLPIAAGVATIALGGVWFGRRRLLHQP